MLVFFWVPLFLSPEVRDRRSWLQGTLFGVLIRRILLFGVLY